MHITEKIEKFNKWLNDYDNFISNGKIIDKIFGDKKYVFFERKGKLFYSFDDLNNGKRIFSIENPEIKNADILKSKIEAWKNGKFADLFSSADKVIFGFCYQSMIKEIEIEDDSLEDFIHE